MIDKVYLITHRYDPKFTQLCIASIRYWYPEVEIYLIKNNNNGSFSTRMLERTFQVKIIDAKDKDLGTYYGKFEVLFQEEKSRFFTVDNDTVFAGKVLDYADQFETDFVVDREQQTTEDTKKLYYNPDKAKQLASSFPTEYFTFNMGQWAGTSGIFSRKDVEEVLYWDKDGTPHMRYPEDFRMYDQSVFNYLLNKKFAEKAVTIARIPLMYYPKTIKHDPSLLEAIRQREVNEPRVIHWAGLKKKRYAEMNLPEILIFYNEYLYSRLSFWDGTLNKINIWLLGMEGYINLNLGQKVRSVKRRLRSNSETN